MQGGSVAVESEEGKGTTFTVTLAYVKAEPLEAPAVRAESKLFDLPITRL